MKSPIWSCCLVPFVVVLGVSSCGSTAEAELQPAREALAEPRATEAKSPDVAKADVKTLEFQVEIAAPVEKVWDVMFSPEGYTLWTAPFVAGSYFEGSWAEGERMHFLAPGGSGMVAEIAANRPREFVSIKHLGYVFNGVEDTTSDGVRSWAPAYENYRFESVPGGTLVKVEHDTLVSFEEYMQDTWPKALAALGALCEVD